MLQKCSSAASSGGLKSVDAAQKINAWHCCPILVSACSCLTIKVLTSHIHWLTVLFNQMNLTGFWNVLFLHEKGFRNDHLKCKVHTLYILMPVLPCPHAIFFVGKIVVHAEKFKGTCNGLKGIIFKIQVWIPIARSLRSRRIQYAVYHAKSTFFFANT